MNEHVISYFKEKTEPEVFKGVRPEYEKKQATFIIGMPGLDITDHSNGVQINRTRAQLIADDLMFHFKDEHIEKITAKACEELYKHSAIEGNYSFTFKTADAVSVEELRKLETLGYKVNVCFVAAHKLESAEAYPYKAYKSHEVKFDEVIKIAETLNHDYPMKLYTTKDGFLYEYDKEGAHGGKGHSGLLEKINEIGNAGLDYKTYIKYRGEKEDHLRLLKAEGKSSNNREIEIGGELINKAEYYFFLHDSKENYQDWNERMGRITKAPEIDKLESESTPEDRYNAYAKKAMSETANQYIGHDCQLKSTDARIIEAMKANGVPPGEIVKSLMTSLQWEVSPDNIAEKVEAIGSLYERNDRVISIKDLKAHGKKISLNSDRLDQRWNEKIGKIMNAPEIEALEATSRPEDIVYAYLKKAMQLTNGCYIGPNDAINATDFSARLFMRLDKRPESLINHVDRLSPSKQLNRNMDRER